MMRCLTLVIIFIFIYERKAYLKMSLKKTLKKSVVLGALMATVITGNAYAESVEFNTANNSLSVTYTPDEGESTTYDLASLAFKAFVMQDPTAVKTVELLAKNVNEYTDVNDNSDDEEFDFVIDLDNLTPL